MIAWFQSDRQEECGCSSKVITVYFGHTRTALIAHQYDLLSQLCLTKQSSGFLSGGAFNCYLTHS